jgi:hypothetical protein
VNAPKCAWCAEPAAHPAVRYGAPYCSLEHSIKGRWDDRGLPPAERLARLAQRVLREDIAGQGVETASMLRARVVLLQEAPRKAAEGAAAAAAHWASMAPDHPLTAIYREAAEYCAQAAGHIAPAPTLEVLP